MNKEEIIDFVKRNGGASAAEIQKSCGVGYKYAKEIIDEMVSAGKLVYAKGVWYNYTGSPYTDNPVPSSEDYLSDLRRRREEIIERLRAEDEKKKANPKPRFTSLKEYLEMRKKESGEQSADAEGDSLFDDEDEGKVPVFKEDGAVKIRLFDDDDEDESPFDGDDEPTGKGPFDDDDLLFGECDEEQEDGSDKNPPISADDMPEHYLWDDEEEFDKIVMERMERLIKSDRRMGRDGAVKKAEACLDAVRDTIDMRMIEVYERLVYELKNTSVYMYGQLKKQYFND